MVTIGRRLRSSLEADLTDEDYEAEAAEAASVLGVSHRIGLNMAGRTTVVTHDLLLTLVRVFRAERPDIFYIPHRHEADSDHRRAAEAAEEAIWMAQSSYFEEEGAPLPSPRAVLAYEVWTPMAAYQRVEDISGFIDAKVEAMRCYRSQLRHGPWDEAIRGLAAYRGLVAQGGGHAEVFAVLHLGKGIEL